MEYRIPRYLHRPILLVWMEQDTWVMAAIGYLIGTFWGGWYYIAVVLLPYSYSKVKDNMPRGGLTHMQYLIGVLRFHGYPEVFESDFHE